ncbi:hypothetical protein [Candidatus Portiera aleyrodidarum]|uniref:Uncharacterized protein n=1 Tax=Candidatus Portiera aleyrodidarum TaxID=91844 RepID=A0A6S6RSB4_9GAMM|nr:hypothetical protein [Candidatus Portiera aleyrodidarum]CAA3707086.1 hypothetical protein PEMO_0190 [Candidatus Portiera aleyrodidarum]
MKKDFPINKIKSKEIYFFIDKRNKNKLNSMLFITKRKKIKMIYKDFTKLNIDIYIIKYKNIKKTLYKVDIKKNIIKLNKKYIFKLKVVKKYILLNKSSCENKKDYE